MSNLALFHTEDFIEGRKAEAEGRPRLPRQVGGLASRVIAV